MLVIYSLFSNLSLKYLLHADEYTYYYIFQACSDYLTLQKLLNECTRTELTFAN